jgi:acetyltransferase-like isoleucine patch superfamily enzyme
MPKSVVRRIFNQTWRRPRGLASFGRGSSVERPWKIDHARYILIGENSNIRAFAWLSAIPEYAGKRYSPKLKIGDDVYMGHYACVTCIDRVDIGDGCVLSEHVYIADSFHGIDPKEGPIMERVLGSKGPVVIGCRSFLGYRSSVLSGVTLGEHCIVGAHSVVTDSFPKYTMLAGAPARAIKTYCEVSGQWEPVSRSGAT